MLCVGAVAEPSCRDRIRSVRWPRYRGAGVRESSRGTFPAIASPSGCGYFCAGGGRRARCRPRLRRGSAGETAGPSRSPVPLSALEERELVRVAQRGDVLAMSWLKEIRVAACRVRLPTEVRAGCASQFPLALHAQRGFRSTTPTPLESGAPPRTP